MLLKPAIALPISRGSFRNNLYNSALRFGLGLADLIERNRRNSQSYFEDSASEDQSKMA